MAIKKRILKMAVLLMIMIVLYEISSKVLLFNNTGAEAHIRNFYREPKNSIDVAVIGCSEVYTDYSPPLAYGEFGFTSYNLGYGGAPGKLYNSMLCEYLKRQAPQLIVFEVNGFFYNEALSSREEKLRLWVDNIPKSYNWLHTINSNVQTGERKNYYLSLAKYHSNWQNYKQQFNRINVLTRNLHNGVALMKGFSTMTTPNYQYEEGRKEKNLVDYGRKQLNDTIAYCKQCGLENVLFVMAPHVNYMSESCREEFRQVIYDSGYDFLDCEVVSADIGIDLYNDFYNREHLNVFGNEKFTQYLGEYIMSNYDINTNHSEKVDELWTECYQYTKEAFKILKERTLLNEEIYYCEDLSEEIHQKILERLERNKS